MKICGFGALECLPKHSPVSLSSVCVRPSSSSRGSSSSSLPRLIPYARGSGRGDDPIPVSRSQMREIRDFDCCRGNRCLSLLNAAFFLARLPRMHDYHANVSPGSQVSAGHIERKRSLSLSLHVCVQIRRLGVLECVMLDQAGSAYEVWVVR